MPAVNAMINASIYCCNSVAINIHALPASRAVEISVFSCVPLAHIYLYNYSNYLQKLLNHLKQNCIFEKQFLLEI